MGADTSSLKGTAQNPQLQWLSNLSPGYIMKLKERFEYASDDFTLDAAALKQFFKCSDREIKVLFEHFDMDGNGKLDSYEFVCAMSMLSHTSLEDKAELIFNLYDFDGNKYISRDEMVILMTNVLSSLHAMKKLPAPSIQEIESKTEDFFNKADADHDKKITLKEFTDYVTKDKEILEILLNANVAKREDLGTDYGTGQGVAPDLDADLEAECNPKALGNSQRKQNIKEGVDISVKDDNSLFQEEDMGEGDQFMAVKPWKGVVDHSVPTNYKRSVKDGEAPDAKLQLEYIHGYRCHDARNNLRYTATNQIVYHAAAVGIVLDPKTNTQKFFNQHTDDILCMAMDPTGQFCATGQIGPKPWLLIWNNDTMECVARISGTLLKGIKNIAFSNDGRFIAASAYDDDHCIAVYNWNAKLKAGETLKPVATGKGTRNQILSLAFSPNGNEVVATCVKEVKFFTFEGGLVTGKSGTGWTNNQTSVLCQAFVGPTLFTGLFDGTIVSWNGRTIKTTFKAHTDGCHSLIARPKEATGLISGGGDGLIIIWTVTGGVLQQVTAFDLKQPEVKSMMPKVRSVYENPTQKGLLLVGTRGGEIVEFGGPKPAIYIRSHFDGELWGLATHPTREEFVTVGEDNIMAIWDIKTRKQKRFGKLDQAAKVAAFSKDGSMLAIGYINGALHVMMYDNKFAMKASKKDCKLAISEIKFSPNDTFCAVGAHDSCIILYDVAQNFKPLRKMKGHHSTVAHFDFSLDSKYLMSNCTSYEILFFDNQTGKNMPSGASMHKNETWASWTCSLGWPVQGIFPPCADGTDINAVDRSPENLVLATGDDFGHVKLFKFPCPVDKASFVQFNGHSSHVTNVRFMKTSNYLISTGGEDKCVFQWKYILDKDIINQTAVVPNTAAPKFNIDSDMAAEVVEVKTAPVKGKQVVSGGMFEEEDMGEGDQRMAVIPFLGEVKASWPSGFKAAKDAGEVPKGNIKLKYAFGFRSFDTRSNLKYTSATEIAYTTAALGVLLNKPGNTQKFFNLHEEDVVSLAIHPSKDIIATGQMASKGKGKLIDIFVWRVSTLEVIAHLKDFHKGAVRKIEFSPQGDKLMTIGEDAQNSVAIYDWAHSRILCKSPVGTDRVFDACWKDDQEFATVGLKHVQFYKIVGINIEVTKGLFGATGIVPSISCHYAFQEKVFVTGTPTGELNKWDGRNIGKTFKSHTDALWTIQSIQKGALLVTGGNDGKLIIMDKTFAVKQTFDLTPMSSFPVGVRAFDYNETAKTFLVGTRSAEIIELNLSGQKLKTLMYGHFQGAKDKPELWGCAVHPKQQTFATCGADMTIRLWKDNQMTMASSQFKDDLTAIDWSSDGEFLIVGDRAGMIHLIDPKNLASLGSAPSSLANKKDAWIEDLKISPDSSMVAFGTHGGLSKVDIVQITDNGKKLKPMSAINTNISSALTHLDWSTDSSTVVINSQAYELMWVDVKKKKTIMASSAKDIMWHTWTSTLGFPVQGIWAPCSDFSDVNSVCRSTSQTILATADDFGKVNLYKYPCVVERASCSAYLGHSSHVTKVKFSLNDKFLVSTGGNDKTVLIWETDFEFIPEKDMFAQDEVEGDQAGFEMYEDAVEDFGLKKKLTKAVQGVVMAQAEYTLEADMFENVDMGAGDEFMSVVPWKGQIREPTNHRKPQLNQEKAPQVQLELEWVHGYRAHDSRNNIGVLQDQSIAYHAAGLGICYDEPTHTQRFFNNHIDDVTAIAFSPDKRLIATGEIGAKPIICIWDGITMQLKYQLKGKLTKGIQSMSFSPSGKSLAAVAIDDNHNVAVYSSETGTLLGTTTGDKAQILDIAMKDDTIFATSGIKHFKLWTIRSPNLTSEVGNFGKYDPRHGACKYMGEKCLSGSITGDLYVWEGNCIKSVKKLHSKPIDAIHVTTNYVFTGGKDSKVNILQANSLTLLFTFELKEEIWDSLCTKVRALCLNSQENILYVGTLGSELYQVSIDIPKKTIGAPKKLLNGHYSPSMKDTNEVWGLAVFPNQTQYVSVSDDCTLRVWDSKTKKQIKAIALNVIQTALPIDPNSDEAIEVKGRSVDISPDGKICAVGFRGGFLNIYNAEKWTLTKRIQVSPNKKWIQDLKFSPDQKQLAVSSHDCKIYILNVGTYDTKHTLSTSSSAVTHIDWSIDSKSIHSNDLSYELLYYNLAVEAKDKQDKKGVTNYRDEDWKTWTLPLGWPVTGIWPTSVDGQFIDAVDRSNIARPDGYRLLASADDNSKVKLFRYPSLDDESQFVVGKGHSSHVTQLKFSSDDKYLFSAGGNDTCIFQWKISAL